MSDKYTNCQRCQQPGEDRRRCTGCYTVYYCSKQCQRSDWTSHKKACKEFTNKGADHSTSRAFAPDEIMDTVDEASKPEAEKSSFFENYETSQSDKSVETSARDNTGNEASESTDKMKVKSNCMSCSKYCHTMTCAKCKVVSYCSKACQKKDWPVHKKSCKKETDERMTPDTSAFTNFRLRASPTPDMLTLHDPPVGSFSRAVHAARTRFPGWNIIERFDDIPEEVFPEYQKQSMRNILVAYMFMFHPYVMRHGIYLKDCGGNKTHVDFYPDYDNPWPYFSYTDVTPGNYIFIQNPLMHQFMDGQVGLRIDDPSEVSVCKIKSLM